MGSYETICELIRLTKSSHLSEAGPMARPGKVSYFHDGLSYHVNIADISKRILYGE